MTLLSAAQLRDLQAAPGHVCSVCHVEVRKDYCRDHDEFFINGHDLSCPTADRHFTCRVYGTSAGPVVESTMAEWAEHPEWGRILT